MTSLAKKQLSKVKFADLSNYDANTNEYFIPKKVEIKLELNNCYIIKVSDSWRTNKLIANTKTAFLYTEKVVYYAAKFSQ